MRWLGQLSDRRNVCGFNCLMSAKYKITCSFTLWSIRDHLDIVNSLWIRQKLCIDLSSISVNRFYQRFNRWICMKLSINWKSSTLCRCVSSLNWSAIEVHNLIINNDNDNDNDNKDADDDDKTILDKICKNLKSCLCLLQSWFSGW